MGMFDYMNYQGHEYQTKDTPEQSMETYEIRDGELWYKKVEREWVDDGNTFLCGYLQEVSHEWKFCKNFDGEIRFYREDKDSGGYKDDAWIEYKALFMDGKIIKLTEVKDD